MDEETFAFGSFHLIPAQRMLFEDGRPLRLGSRALDILVTLVERAGETIHKDQLIAGTWPDTVVDEGALRTKPRHRVAEGLGHNLRDRHSIAPSRDASSSHPMLLPPSLVPQHTGP